MTQRPCIVPWKHTPKKSASCTLASDHKKSTPKNSCYLRLCIGPLKQRPEDSRKQRRCKKNRNTHQNIRDTCVLASCNKDSRPKKCNRCVFASGRDNVPYYICDDCVLASTRRKARQKILGSSEGHHPQPYPAKSDPNVLPKTQITRAHPKSHPKSKT